MTFTTTLLSTAILLAVGTPALAQTSVAPPPINQPSTVQLYGILDVGPYEKQLAGERKVTSLVSGGMTTSRWGLSGNEDLGGGLRALFDLSSFIRVDTGEFGRVAGDPYFARYAYVGLSSPTWGAVRAGRITTATFLSEVSFGAFLDSTTFGPYLLHTFLGSGGQPMITGNGLLDSAWSNSVAYYLPTIGGIPNLVGSVQVAAGEGGNGRRAGGGLTYRGDTFGATFTIDDVKRGALAVGAPVPTLATVARPSYTARDVRTYQGGAYYDFKVVRLWAQANQTTFSNSTPTEIRLRTYALSATVPVGAGNVMIEWARTANERTNAIDLKRNTGAIGYDYFVSKRTDIYAVAITDRVTNLNNGNGFSAGVRHRF